MNDLNTAVGKIANLMRPVPVENGSNRVISHRGFSNSFGSSDGSLWPAGISGSGTGILFNNRKLLINGRVAYHQTPQAHSLVTRMADTVADTGLRWEPMPKVSMLGITPEEGLAWSRDVKSRFDAWAKNKDQHRSGTMSWYQSQRFYQISQHRDNDIFTRFYYSKDKHLLNPLQFEFVDALHIRGAAFTSTTGFHSAKDGIHRDAQGRETAYDVWLRKPDGSTEPVTINARTANGARILMLHGFMPEYAGQGRGLSRLGNDVQNFQKITDLTAAEIQKAIIQSSIWGFVKPSEKEDAHNVLEGMMTNRGAGPAANQFGSNPSPDAAAENVSDNSLKPLSCYDIPEATIDRPGLFIANLPAGQSIEMVKNTAPVTNFDTFVDSFTSYLSSARSMPIEVLLMKFGQNFSASRGALLLFWRVAQIWRDEMALDYLNPTVSMWMSEEIAAGRVSAPGWSDPRLRAAWLNCIWIGPPAPDIDPARTSKARKDNIEAGVTTRSIEALNYNGSDFDTNKPALIRENEGMPVPSWSNGFNSDASGSNENLRNMLSEIMQEINEEN